MGGEGFLEAFARGRTERERAAVEGDGGVRVLGNDSACLLVEGGGFHRTRIFLRRSGRRLGGKNRGEESESEPRHGG